MDDRAELKRRGDELRARLRAKDPEGKHRPWETKQTAQEAKNAVLDVECVWRGRRMHGEPCTCGAAKKIDIYLCENAKAAKRRCVPLSMDWGKMKDPDSRTACVVCENCPLRSTQPIPDPFSGEPVVHFGAHLWPVRGRWEWHAPVWAEIAETINGLCLVGVAIDDTTSTWDEVRALLPDRFEMFTVPSTKDSNPVKAEGENHTFRELQKRIPSGPDDVLLYVHGKGVRRDPAEQAETCKAIRLWTELLYETVAFNQPEYLRRLADGYKSFGAFRADASDSQNIIHRWYWSGTFFAIRAKHLPGKVVKPVYGGVEHFCGNHFKRHEGWCELADNRGISQEYETIGLYPEAVNEGFAWEVKRIGGVRCEQHLRELEWFARQLRPTDRVLVIGSNQGGLEAQLRHRVPGIQTVSVDIAPHAANVEPVIVGDSADPETQERARASGPFDVVFIDGDHSVAVVTSDWEFARSLSPRLIAFHDVANGILHDHHGCQVDQLWQKIKDSNTYRTTEKCVGCGWGGIGIVHYRGEQT